MALLRSELPLPLLYRGKVRDVYEVPGDRLLLVASDRVSAFDIGLEEPVPGKGRLLTQMTAWWMSTHFPDVPHHLLSVRSEDILRAVPALAGCRDPWEGRTTLARRTRPLPVECVVRGYLSGSAWKEYRESGTLAGEPLPIGLRENGALALPIFSPATKAREGKDENITLDHARRLLGRERAHRLQKLSLDIYARARAVAAVAGIILADTKFEFGTTEDGTLLLIDEVLTPDSSRFWPQESYSAGSARLSFDKQLLRDYLDGIVGWNRCSPPPPLPASVTSATSRGYREAFRRLTGSAVEDFKPPDFGT